MKMLVYNFREDEREFFEKYADKYQVELGTVEDYPSVDNAELAKGYDAINIIVTDMNRELMTRFYEMGVRYITTRSIGIDHIDLECAKEIGMTITNVSYSPDSVANFAIMLMLMCCRKATYQVERCRIQDYRMDRKRGRELSAMTVGIIGTGRIGRTVIKHLSAFGCRLIAYDPYRNPEVEQYAEYTDLDNLLKNADIISLHIPATKENRHLIDAASFEKMKDGVILINTARGSLIDSEALIDALENGKAGGAGLDVIENEWGLYYKDWSGKVIPNKELAMLKSFPNVVITPHTAFYTDQAVDNITENSIKGVILARDQKENPWKVV